VMHKTILMSKELECKKTDKNKKHWSTLQL
jgi:hypothetical protein